MHYVHKCINSLVHTKLQMEPRSEFAIYCLAPSSCVLVGACVPVRRRA